MKNIIRLKEIDTDFFQIENICSGVDENGLPINSMVVEVELTNEICNYRIDCVKGTTTESYDCLKDIIKDNIAYVVIDNKFFTDGTTGNVVLTISKEVGDAYSTILSVSIKQGQVLNANKHWFLKYDESGLTITENINENNLYGNIYSNATNKISFGTSEPSGGNHGDVYFLYS